MQSQYDVLVVEDDALWRDKLQLVLTNRGHRVEVVSSYEQAQSALADRRFDLAVVDLSLVRGSATDRQGLQLLDEELSKHQGMAAVVVTAYGTLEEASQWAKTDKAFAFVGKQDFDSDRFLHLVDMAVKAATARFKEASRAKAKRSIRRHRPGD